MPCIASKIQPSLFQFKHCTIIRLWFRYWLRQQLISIQALYDYKDQPVSMKQIRTLFQFKHCTIISSNSLSAHPCAMPFQFKHCTIIRLITLIKHTGIFLISIQALYDYKTVRTKKAHRGTLISIQALYDYKVSTRRIRSPINNFNSSIVRL